MREIMAILDLATIVINYKMEEQTCSFVREELSKCKLDNVVVIVDNGATEESSQKISKTLSTPIVRDINADVDENCRCFVIFNKENTGFARGNNLGVEFVYKHFECKYLLFSNNDIRLEDPDVVEQLIAKLESLPDVGVIGPKVVGLDGHCQSPYNCLPFWQETIGVRIEKIFPYFIHIDRVRHDSAKEGYYHHVMGCFFLISTFNFQNCGMMDINTFLYYEESCLAERLLQIGKKEYYYPDYSVLHDHGATVKKQNMQKTGKSFLEKSMYYFYKEYKHVSSLSIYMSKIFIWSYTLLKRLLPWTLR